MILSVALVAEVWVEALLAVALGVEALWEAALTVLAFQTAARPMLLEALLEEALVMRTQAPLASVVPLASMEPLRSPSRPTAIMATGRKWR